MGKSNAKATLLRKTLITGSLLGLIVLFFVINYLVIIPRQQSSYNKKIFRILHEQSENLEAVISAYAVSYRRAPKMDSQDLAFHWKKKYTDTLKFVNDLKSSFNAKEILFGKEAVAPDVETTFIRDYVLFRNSKKNQKAKRSVEPVPDSFPMSISNIVEPIQAMHENIFDFVILTSKIVTGKKENILLYKSPLLDVDETKLAADTLDSSLYPFATLRDTVIEGAAYKLFTLPFRFGGQFLSLSGFIDLHEYKSNITGSSYPVLLLIGSMMVIVLISLPFLKIFFLGRKENLTITDIRLLITAFLAGPALFVLMISTVNTYYHTDNRTDNFLDSLHKKVKNSFYNEISSGIKQLRLYDSIVNHPCSSKVYKSYNRACCDQALFDLRDKKNTRRRSYRKNTVIDFKDSFFYPTIYKIFDWVSWTNSKGKNIAKWGFLDTSFHYLDLSERKYFQDIRDGNMDTLPAGPGRDTGRFAMQPTMSWANGAYTINLAIPSQTVFQNKNGRKDSAIMISLSSSMYSVCDPVVPKGFNFCIVNDKGDVLFHSQTSRSLHENFFEECNNNPDVIKAISHKDSVRLTGVTLYDHEVKMKITPIEGMHYYFIIYYTLREQNYFVFHISAFALFATIMLQLMLLLFLLSYSLSSNKLSSSFFRIHESDWMAPSPLKNSYYRTLFLFQLLLLSAISALLIFISIIYPERLCRFILQCSILLPFISTTGYYIIRRNLELSVPTTKKLTDGKKIWYWYYFFLLIFFICNFTQYQNKIGLNIGFDLGLMILATAIPYLARFVCRRRPPVRDISPDPSYLSNYNRIIFCAILLISVLPTLGFFYYGFKKEEILRYRSRQIYLAEGIERKTAAVSKDIKRRKTDINTTIFGADDATYTRNRLYRPDFGVYPAVSKVTDTVFDQYHGNKILKASDGLMKKNMDLYQLVTKFLFLPPDHTDFFYNTNYYYWDDPTDWITLYYENKNALDKNETAIRISLKPGRNEMLSQLATKPFGWLLVISVAVFLVSTYKIIIPLARRIFLIGYFEKTRLVEADKHWVNEILKSAKLNNGNPDPTGKNGKINYDEIVKKEERQPSNGEHGIELILRMQNHLLPAYDEIWKQCSPTEKYVLFDFATDGFTNYRNSDVLFGLYQHGLIRKDRETSRLMIMNYSFRNYLIAKANTDEVQELEQSAGGGIWKNLKTIFFVLLVVGFVYIFIAQEEIKNKLLVIIPGVVTLLPQVLKLFDKNNFSPAKTDTK